MIFHNLHTYHRGNTNNFFGLEFDWNITKHLTFHSQVLIDQLQIHTEAGTTVPNAYGVLANLKYSLPCGPGHLTLYGEYVYTNPALYLKPDDGSDTHYRYDLIVGNRMWEDSMSSYLGYVHGPNTVLGLVGVNYLTASTVAEMRIQFKATGDTGLYRDDECPTGDGALGSISPWCNDPTKVPEYMLQVMIEAKTELRGELVSVHAGAAYQHYWNYENLHSRLMDNLELKFGIGINVGSLIRSDDRTQ